MGKTVGGSNSGSPGDTGHGTSASTGSTRTGGPSGFGGGQTAASKALSGKTINKQPNRPVSGGTSVTYGYTPGAVPNIPDPSAGQVVSGLMMAPAGPLGVLGAIAGMATADQSGRTLAGQAVDSATGSTPGKQEGWQPDRDRNNTGGPSGSDSVVPATAALRALTGDVPTAATATDGGPDQNFSDVTLQDRRRPRTAASRMMMGVAA
jgi:hypothetical protein